MATLVPTITAFDKDTFNVQMKLAASLSKRVHIDLMNGTFAPTISPAIDEVWWPEGVIADVHLMYKRPLEVVDELARLRPHLVIVHAEAEGNYVELSRALNAIGIKTGIALLPNTQVSKIVASGAIITDVLIFSGKLGYHGGVADLSLLHKVQEIRAQWPHAEISWDGGINDQNVQALVSGGIDVLNIGGFIQKAADPKSAYRSLQSVLTA